LIFHELLAMPWPDRNKEGDIDIACQILEQLGIDNDLSSEVVGVNFQQGQKNQKVTA